jgi:hypothetical protein
MVRRKPLGGVAGQVALNDRLLLAFQHHGQAVVGDRSAEDDHVSRPNVVNAEVPVRAAHARAGGVDVQTVGLAAGDDLRVAGDDLHTCLVGGGRGRIQDAAQQIDLESLLEDQSKREKRRRRAAHGQVVDGAADGQAPDVAPGELQRLHDVAVGREDQVPLRHRHHGRVVEGTEILVGEARADDLVQ